MARPLHLLAFLAAAAAAFAASAAPVCDTGSFLLRADFPGARMSACEVVATDEVAIDIRPEDGGRINPSPWYAFHVRTHPAAAAEELRVWLRYGDHQHRYAPKVSVDGASWERLPSAAVQLRNGDAMLLPAGGAVAQVGESLWGITFVFGLLLALLVKALLGAAGRGYLLEERGLTRISGSAVDFMVAAALGAIPLTLVRANWLPIVVFAALLAGAAAVSIRWLASRLFAHDHAFERVVLFWGTLTGTLSTGLALLRALDPEFKTPAAADYLYASALTFFLVLPLVLIMGFPALAYATGNPNLYLVTLAVLLCYLALVAAAFALLTRRAGVRGFSALTRVWFTPPPAR